MAHKFRVWLRSKPGFYAQYNGYVDVFCHHEKDAFDKAVSELRRKSFPDRGRGMWRLEKIERIR